MSINTQNIMSSFEADKKRHLALLRNFLRFTISSIVKNKLYPSLTAFTNKKFCGLSLSLIDSVDHEGNIKCEKSKLFSNKRSTHFRHIHICLFSFN